MSLLERARNDIANISSNTGGFGVEMSFISPASPAETCTITGLFSRHHIDVNRQGVAFNSRMAHVSVSESIFDEADYTIRNANGEVDLKGHRVTVEWVQYVVSQWFPSDTGKLITIILGKYGT
jgi:hypothetical protein